MDRAASRAAILLAALFFGSTVGRKDLFASGSGERLRSPVAEAQHVPDSVPALQKSLFVPFSSPPRQWHPVVVHFPIVFLFVEAVLLLGYARSRRDNLEQWSYAFLKLSFWSMLPVAVAGVHDSGLDLGAGNPLWLGLGDRLKNALNLHSSISLHVLLASLVLAMTGARLAWRWRRGRSARQGRGIWPELVLVALGLWIVTAAGYAGGMVSHT